MCSFFTLLNVPVDKKVSHIDKRKEQGAWPRRKLHVLEYRNSCSTKKCSLFQRRYNQFREITISRAVPYIPETSDTNRSPISKKKKKKRKEGEEGGKREKKGRRGIMQKAGLKTFPLSTLPSPNTSPSPTPSNGRARE